MSKKKPTTKDVIKAMLGGSDKSGRPDATHIDGDKKQIYYTATAGLPESKENHGEKKAELPTIKTILDKVGVYGVEKHVKDKKDLEKKSSNMEHGLWSDYEELKESFWIKRGNTIKKLSPETEQGRFKKFANRFPNTMDWLFDTTGNIPEPKEEINQQIIRQTNRLADRKKSKDKFGFDVAYKMLNDKK